MLALFNHIDGIEISDEQVQSVAQTGSNDVAVAELREVPEIKEQLDKIDPKALKSELKEYGAWTDEELNNHDQNLSRILWIACWNIADGVYET